jgi:aryl-alcohol dehydrogenase-like predicted oxidoreductase
MKRSDPNEISLPWIFWTVDVANYARDNDLGVPDWGCDEKESQAIIKKYLDAGGNCLDIADIYAGGRSEEIVGNLMPDLNRDGIIIASKFSLPSGKAVTHLLRCQAQADDFFM